MHVTATDAQTYLGRLMDRAMSGEDIVITRRGRPTVRLVSIAFTEELRPDNTGCSSAPQPGEVDGAENR
jgi:prevent-host-death family protein